MYKFRIYKTSCINDDNLEHEEFFKNESEMYKRYRELLYDRKDCITVWKSTGTVSVILETKKLILSKTQENYYMNRVKKGGLFRG